MRRLLSASLTIVSVVSDFLYTDFSDSTGLKFLGSAGTTNCGTTPKNDYGDVHNKADLFNEESGTELGERTDLVFISDMSTNREADNYETENELAGFLHRSDTVSAPNSCAVRARLTPSGPSKIGAMWFRDNVPISNGFETSFTFQITDHSKECTLHLDQYFSLKHHRTCSVRGGDGFAFVLHMNEDGPDAIGKTAGGQMGFGGIDNSLAIAFDTWQNQGHDYIGVDHVSIQSKGTEPNDALEDGLLGLPRVTPLADGIVHRAKVVYYGDIVPKYFGKLVASESLLKYLLDNSEQKRIGTLVVFVDKGIEDDIPLMAMPINLSLLLRMPTDKAYVGFTSATGRFYEKHDILSWYFCDQPPCGFETVHKFETFQESIFSDEVIKRLSTFDYHNASKIYTDAKLRDFGQGEGYGGGYNTEGFPVRHTSPDTTPSEKEIEHHSNSRERGGLSPKASSQVPPSVQY